MQGNDQLNKQIDKFIENYSKIHIKNIKEISLDFIKKIVLKIKSRYTFEQLYKEFPFILECIIGIHEFKTILPCKLNKDSINIKENNDNYVNELLIELDKMLKLKENIKYNFFRIPKLNWPNWNIIYFPIFYYLVFLNIEFIDILNNPNINQIWKKYYWNLINKSFAILILIQDLQLDSAYILLRNFIEELINVLIFLHYPNVLDEKNLFNNFSINNCDFISKWEKHKSDKSPPKRSFLDYGWVDEINNYHDVIKENPYSFNGIINFLTKANYDFFWKKYSWLSKNNTNKILENIHSIYKKCCKFVHNNFNNEKISVIECSKDCVYPMYFIILMYYSICHVLHINPIINEIDIFEELKSNFGYFFEKIYK